MCSFALWLRKVVGSLKSNPSLKSEKGMLQESNALMSLEASARRLLNLLPSIHHAPRLIYASRDTISWLTTIPLHNFNFFPFSDSSSTNYEWIFFRFPFLKDSALHPSRYLTRMVYIKARRLGSALCRRRLSLFFPPPWREFFSHFEFIFLIIKKRLFICLCRAAVFFFSCRFSRFFAVSTASFFFCAAARYVIGKWGWEITRRRNATFYYSFASIQIFNGTRTGTKEMMLLLAILSALKTPRIVGGKPKVIYLPGMNEEISLSMKRYFSIHSGKLCSSAGLHGKLLSSWLSIFSI